MKKINFKKITTLALALIAIFSPAFSNTTNAQTITSTTITENTQAATSTQTINQTTNIVMWPQIIAESAIVYDPVSNITYFEKGADIVRPLASIAKLATASVVEDLLTMNPNFEKTLLTIKKYTDSNEADRALINGTRWYPDTLVKYMLIGSSNKAAENLASQIIPRGPFISLMNFKAKQWGLTSTNFNNPSGIGESKTTYVNGKAIKTLSPGANSTAREVVKLMWNTIEKYPNILDVTRDQIGVFSSTDSSIIVKNTDKIIDALPIIFGKTGFTELAGGNLAVVIQKNPTDHPLIIVVMGSTQEGRFSDTLALASSTMPLMHLKESWNLIVPTASTTLQSSSGSILGASTVVSPTLSFIK